MEEREIGGGVDKGRFVMHIVRACELIYAKQVAEIPSDA